MPQRGRTPPPLTPAQVRAGQVDTFVPKGMDAWDGAEEYGSLDRSTVAIGVTQNRETGMFHTWLSMYGTGITSWGVFRDQARAEAFMHELQALWQHWSGSEADVQAMDALLKRGTQESDDPRAVLPDAQVREVLALVAEQSKPKSHP
jgi:hypothetical protein